MIKGFRGTSLVDYPGKISSVVFTYGCNFRCPYCYNIDLVLPERYSKLEDIPEDVVIEELKRRKGFIKGVVITGGEPTLWERKLVYFIERVVYEVGLPVKLDTNGSLPDVVKSLVEMDIIDYWAIDFKTAPERYKEVKGDFSKVEKSFEYLKPLGFRVEVRITCYPPLVGKDEIKKMIPYLEGFKRIAIQKYEPYDSISGEKVEPYTKEFYLWLKEFLLENLRDLEVIERF